MNARQSGRALDPFIQDLHCFFLVEETLPQHQWNSIESQLWGWYISREQLYFGWFKEQKWQKRDRDNGIQERIRSLVLREVACHRRMLAETRGLKGILKNSLGLDQIPLLILDFKGSLDYSTWLNNALERIQVKHVCFVSDQEQVREVLQHAENNIRLVLKQTLKHVPDVLQELVFEYVNICIWFYK
jgi:hypothetical protein